MFQSIQTQPEDHQAYYPGCADQQDLSHVGILVLPGMEEAVRENLRAAAHHLAADQCRLIEVSLRTPAADISQSAGRMERNAPLFFGSDASDQPSLFAATLNPAA